MMRPASVKGKRPRPVNGDGTGVPLRASTSFAAVGGLGVAGKDGGGGV
jgi:hypothetical protein